MENIGNSLCGLTLEVTRRCNLQCQHCLRGQQQNKNLDTKKLKRFLKNISSIDHLFLTGGEPLLACKTIDDIRKIIKVRKIKLCSAAIVTNASVVNDKVIKTIRDLFDVCEDKENNYIHVSKTEFHGWDEKRQSNFEELCKHFPDVSIDTGRIKTLKIGRSLETGDMEPDRGSGSVSIEYVKSGNRLITEVMGNIYFSCHGSIHEDYEMSFDEIDGGFNKIISVDSDYKFSNFIKAIKN